MKQKFFLFLFYFLTIISFSQITISTTDWRTFRYDTLHDSIPEETFSRFDLGLIPTKEFAFGINTIQPKVIKHPITGYTSGSYLVIPTSTNILYIINKNYNIAGSKFNVQIDSEFSINNFFGTNTDFDIIALTEQADTSQNFTWLKFNGTDINTYFEENIGNRSKGITCDNIYCVFVGENYNHTFFKVMMDDTPSIETLETNTTATIYNYNGSTYGCDKIPVLRDIDYDGNTEAIYCDDVLPSEGRYELLMIDVTNLNMKTTFGTNGIKTDIYDALYLNDICPPILVNLDGNDEQSFEIIIGYSTNANILRINALTYQGNPYNSNYPKTLETLGGVGCNSLSRTDINNDGKYDIISSWTGTSNVERLYGIVGLTGEKLLSELTVHITNYEGMQHIILSDLDNTGSLFAKTGFIGTQQVILFDNFSCADNCDMSKNFSMIDFAGKSNPILADLDNDNIYELLYSKNENTTIYDASYTNQPVNFISYEINTGTPICPEEIVTFTCNGYDNENELINCGIDVYGNGSIEWGVFTRYTNYSITTHEFLTSEIGYVFNNMKIYMSDEGHSYNTEISYDIPISYQVEDSVVCYHAGQGGFEESINETGGFIVGEPVTDFSDFINSILTLTGMNNAIGKGMIVLFVLMMTIVGIARIGNVPSEAYIIILITELGLFAWLEFLPVWLILLMIIVASAFIVWLFSQPTGVAK